MLYFIFKQKMWLLQRPQIIFPTKEFFGESLTPVTESEYGDSKYICMERFWGIYHTHDENFYHPPKLHNPHLFPVVGKEMCEWGVERCTKFQQKIRLEDGSVSNMCRFHHGYNHEEEIVKIKVAKNWKRLFKKEITIQDLYKVKNKK